MREVLNLFWPRTIIKPNIYTENTENCFENLEFLITPVGQDMVDKKMWQRRQETAGGGLGWAGLLVTLCSAIHQETSSSSVSSFYFLPRDRETESMANSHADFFRFFGKPGQPHQRGLIAAPELNAPEKNQCFLHN